VSLIRSKIFRTVFLGTALLLMPQGIFGQEANASPWKDQAEYDIFVKFQGAKDVAGKLAALNEWKEKYPDSKLKRERQETILQVQQSANDSAGIKSAASDLIALDPGSYLAYYALSMQALSNPSTSEADLAEGMKNCQALMDANKPASVQDATWANVKNDSALIGHSCIGTMYERKKDIPAAIEAYQKSFQVTPENAPVSQKIGALYISMKDPKKYPLAFYHYARAVQINGPKPLADADRKKQKDYLERQFLKYREPRCGGNEELANLYKVAMTAPVPPADFYIKSCYDLEKEKYDNVEKLKDDNPSLYLWMTLRDQIKSATGEEVWKSNIQGTMVPPDTYKVKRFKAKLIAAEPEGKATMLKVAVDDPSVADAMLKLSAAVTSKLEAGADVEFRGVALEKSADPYTMTFEVDPADVMVNGAKVVAGPAGAKPRPAAVKRPAAPVKRRK
jgi:tetratricopeptide (TPR) repeat protein